MKDGVMLHGVNVGSEKIGQDEISSSDEKPLRALGKQEIMQNMPKGLGRSVAKKMQYAEKAKLKADSEKGEY